MVNARNVVSLGFLGCCLAVVVPPAGSVPTDTVSAEASTVSLRGASRGGADPAQRSTTVADLKADDHEQRESDGNKWGDLIWPSPHKAAGFYDDWAEIGNAEEQWGPTIQEWEEMRKTWNRGLGEELFPQHLFEIEDVLDEYSMSYSYLW